MMDCDQWDSTAYQGALPGCLQEKLLNLVARTRPRTGSLVAVGRGAKPAAVCEQTLFAFGRRHSTDGKGEQKPLCCIELIGQWPSDLPRVKHVVLRYGFPNLYSLDGQVESCNLKIVPSVVLCLAWQEQDDGKHVVSAFCNLNPVKSCSENQMWREHAHLAARTGCAGSVCSSP